MRHLRRFALLIVAALLGACAGRGDASRLTGADTTATLEITATRSNLVLRNTSTSLIRYFAVNPNILTLALFAPCDSNCAAIAPGQSVIVPYASIMGYDPAMTEAQVTWWRFAPGPFDRVDSSYQSARVPLH